MVHVAAEGIADGLKIDPVTIGVELNAVRQPAGYVVHKLACIFRVTSADQYGED